MKKLGLLLVLFFFSSYSPDECDIKELNYLMQKVELKVKYGELDKKVIREWLCENPKINCL